MAGLIRMIAALIALAAGAGLAAGAFGAVSEKLDLLANFRGHLALLAIFAAFLAAFAGGGRLALAAIVIGALGLAGLWPVWRTPPVAEPRVAASCGVEALTIVSANINHENRRPAEAAAALLALGADVLMTQETSNEFWAEADPLRARYPFLVERQHRWVGSRAIVIWSRRPVFDGVSLRDDGHAPRRALGVIEVGGRRVGLGSLHASWPVVENQRAEIDGLGEAFADLPVDRIIAGDFNAAPWSAAMARAERRLGARILPGLRLTWKGVYPNPLAKDPALPRVWRLPPEPIGLPIDHILVSPGIGVVAVDAVTLPGSDHRAVAARLEIPRFCAEG